MKLKIIYIILATAILFGCDDYLSQNPSKNSNIPVSTANDLDALLGNYNHFFYEYNYSGILASDDFDLSCDIADGYAWAYMTPDVKFGVWDTDATNMYLTYFWQSEYQKIFYANMTLNYLNQVSGDAELKESLRAEAHLIRAYSYFELANSYCLPYCEKYKNELGLPLKQTTVFDELDTRSSLEETYNLIKSDIDEALKIKTPLIKNGKQRHWRGNTAAANAFAARFYLYIGDYEKAGKYADAALNEYNTLIDYNTEMSYIDKKYDFTLTDNGEKVSVLFPKTYYQIMGGQPQEMFGWKEFYYMRVAWFMTEWFMPSKSLLDAYDQKENDLRYKYHIVEGFGYSYLWQPVSTFDYPAYCFFYRDMIPTGLTTAEMYLVKAECQARSGSFSDGMNTLNILRKARIDKNVYQPLTADSQSDAMKKILAERHREMPFVGRWFEMRRLNFNNDPSDDIGTIKKHIYPYASAWFLDTSAKPVDYELQIDSRHYACPIPQAEIDITNGTIKQNQY